MVQLFKTRIELWLSFILFGGMLGIILLGIAFQESELREIVSVPPVELTLDTILTAGPSGHQHITVTEFEFGEGYVVEEENFRWSKTWVPAFPRGKAAPRDPIQCVVQPLGVDHHEDILAIEQQQSITGILRVDSSLGSDVATELKKVNPGRELAVRYLLEEVRRIPNETTIRWLYASAIGVGVLGLVGVVALVYQRWIALPDTADHAIDWLDEIPAWEGENQGPVRHTFQTGSGIHRCLLWLAPLPSAMFLGLTIFIVNRVPVSTWAKPSQALGFAMAIISLGGPGIFILVAWIHALRALRWKLTVHEHGLLQDTGSKRIWTNWRSVRSYTTGALKLTDTLIVVVTRLKLVSGKRLDVSPFFHDGQAVAEAIKDVLVPHLFDRAVQNLRERTPVSFEHVTLRRDGLENAGDVILWRQVESVTVEWSGSLDEVVIRVVGRKNPWLRVPMPMFPNAEVFLQLVKASGH